MRVIKLLVISILLLVPKAWAQHSTLCRGVDFAMDSTGFDFGSIPAGSEKDTSLIVVNYNCDTIWLGGIYTQAPFRCDSALLDVTSWVYGGWNRIAIPLGKSGRLAIAPGDTAILLLRFEPLKVGDFQKNVSIDALSLALGIIKLDTTGISIRLHGAAVASAAVTSHLNPELLELSVFPNPAMNAALISFELPSSAETQILLYNTGGNQVMNLVNGYLQAGLHTVPINAQDLASGDYVCFLKMTGADGITTTSTCKIAIEK